MAVMGQDCTTNVGLLIVFKGAYLTRVRNFLPGCVSVREEAKRAVLMAVRQIEGRGICRDA